MLGAQALRHKGLERPLGQWSGPVSCGGCLQDYVLMKGVCGGRYKRPAVNTPPLSWSPAMLFACCSGGSLVYVSPGTGGRRSLNLASVPLPQ